MRQLILRRERALACFATPYYCLMGREREEFLAWLAEQAPGALMERGAGIPLRNGETVALEIGEEETAFFVAAYLEKRSLVTGQAVIPPGTEDVRYMVRTSYDGYRRLSLSLELEEL